MITIVRRLSLAFFLILMTWLGYQHQVMGGGAKGSPSVDALCPFGGLEGIYNVATTGNWIQRLAPSSLILFIIVVVMTLLLGRFFCGWICPMGALTEFSSMIFRKLGIKKMTVPSGIDRILRWVKYVLLVIIIFFTWKTGTLVFRDYDPWKAWMHITEGFSEGVISMLVLIGVLLAEIKIERFWCRYLCPLGAVFGILQKFSLTKVVRNTDSCIACGKCDRICITGLAPSRQEKVTDADCIACGACVSKCPKSNTLEMKIFNKPIKLTTFAAAGLVIFALTFGVTKATGLWVSFVQPKVNKNMPLKDQIKGWMTIKNIAALLNMPVSEVLKAAELPSDTDVEMPIKQMPGEISDIIKENIEKNIKR